MKLLLLLFLVGCATASVLREQQNEVEDELMMRIEELGEDPMHAFNLKETFQKVKNFILSNIDKEKLKEKVEELFGKGSEMADELLKIINKKGDEYKQKILDMVDRYLGKQEEKRKRSLGEKMKEAWNDFMERIKSRFEEGKEPSNKFTEMLKGFFEKAKDLREDFTKKAKELFETSSEKIKEKIEAFFKKIGINVREEEDASYAAQQQMASLKEMFEKLKEAIRSKIDKEKLKAKIEEIFGKSNEMVDSIKKIIDEKGDKYKQKLLDLIDRFVGNNEEKRSLGEWWEKVKEYFKDLKIKIDEKYARFGQWIKEKMDDAHEKGKQKIDIIKDMAREFVNHGKGVSKEIAEEALEFLRPYKEDMKSLWDQVVDTAKDIMKKD